MPRPDPGDYSDNPNDDGLGCSLPVGKCGVCWDRHLAASVEPVVLKKGWNVAKKKPSPPVRRELLDGEIRPYDEAGLDEDFRTLVLRKMKLSEKKKAIEEEESEIKDQILALVESTGEKALQVDKYRVIYSEGATRKKLDPKLLLKNGVAAEIINKSTVEEKGSPYVMVRETGA